MPFSQKISEDLKEALKSRDDFRAGLLRMVIAALHNKEIEKKGKGLTPELTDEEAIEVLGREAKKRKEAIEIYSKGGRSDIAAKERKELEIINQYLPEQAGDEDIERAVMSAIEKTNASGPKDFGRAMGEAMKGLKGRAEASRVSDVLKKKLGN